MSGLDISSMSSSLQSSIDAAMKRLQTQVEEEKKGASTKAAEEYEQDVRKSSYNFQAFATDIGVLVKDTSRLNVMSSLAAADPVDYYKVKFSDDGAVTLGQVGDTGVRFQLTDKSGNVFADSDEKAGPAYDAYKAMREGTFDAKAGDYIVKVSRAAGENLGVEKNYAFQFTQGEFTKDYDTIARQPSTSGSGGSAVSYLDILRQNGSLDANGAGAALQLLGGYSGGRGSLLNLLF